MLKPFTSKRDSALTSPPRFVKSVHGCVAGCGGVGGATPPHQATLLEVRARTLDCCYDPGRTREHADYEFDEIDEGNVFE